MSSWEAMSAAAPGVDLSEAVAFLETHFGDRARDVSALGDGEWSAAFNFRLDDAERVIRFGQHRDDYEKDRAAMAFAGPDLPVPAVLEIGEALNGCYAISERRHGVFLEELDEAGCRRALPALLRGLDAMRVAQAPAGAGCQFVGDGGEPVTWRQWLLGGLVDLPGGRVSGWRDTLAASVELEGLFAAGADAFTSLLGYVPECRAVVHSDLINRNVMVTPDGSRLVAIFDWGCATFGDFLYDVAWITFWAPWFPGLDAVDFLSSVRAHYRTGRVDVVDFDQRLAAYTLHIGLIHLAYNAFSDRAQNQDALAVRLRQVLNSL